MFDFFKKFLKKQKMTKTYIKGETLLPEDDIWRNYKFRMKNSGDSVTYLGAIYENANEYYLRFRDEFTGNETKILNSKLNDYLDYDEFDNPMTRDIYGATFNFDINQYKTENKTVPENNESVNKSNITEVIGNTNIRETPKSDSEFSKLFKKAKLEKVEYNFKLTVPKINFIKTILDGMDYSETELDIALDEFAEYIWQKNRDEIKITIIENLKQCDV